MKTPVLKRRLNPFLLATTVLVLSLLAGLSVMYQGQLSNVLSDNKDLSQELADIRQQVSKLKAENNNLSQKLDSKNSRIRELSIESSNLESDVETLENRVDELKLDNIELQNRVDHLENQTEGLNQSLGDICDLHWNNMTEGSYSRQQCEKWGHGQSDSE